jgi:hypothetical protein
MSMRDLTRAIIKIMGLFILTHGILYGVELPGLILASLKDQTPLYLALGIVLPFILEIALGVILLRADARLTDTLIFRHDEAKAESAIDLRNVEQIGIALMGLYIAATGLPGLVQNIFQYMKTTPMIHTDVSYFWFSDVSRSLCQVLIGIFLFLGSKGLVGLRHWLLESRRFDVEKDRNE